MASRLKKNALRVVHTASQTVFNNWPTPATPLDYVHSLDISPHSGYMAVVRRGLRHLPPPAAREGPPCSLPDYELGSNTTGTLRRHAGQRVWEGPSIQVEAFREDVSHHSGWTALGAWLCAIACRKYYRYSKYYKIYPPPILVEEIAPVSGGSKQRVAASRGWHRLFTPLMRERYAPRIFLAVSLNAGLFAAREAPRGR